MDGRIIFLNGASSAGKTTLAKALQARLDTPFLHVSSDQLVDMLPARRDESGPFAWWTDLRPRFFAGFHRCIPALAAAGNDLIVDHVVELPAWRDELATLLQGLDVFLVGVHCDLDEIDRRERRRGDRRPGQGRTHVEHDLIHTFGPYDAEVDTTTADPATLADAVLAAWSRRRPATRALAPAPALDLVVLRVADLPASRAFYEGVGVTFVEERHGSGPGHLAGTLGNGVVLELYPTATPSPDQRLGFAVHDLDAVLRAVRDVGGTVLTERSGHAVVVDPDGRKVELRGRHEKSLPGSPIGRAEGVGPS